ncbi:MAG: outer membrane beta-barrel protein [Halioglobus sp.]
MGNSIFKPLSLSCLAALGVGGMQAASALEPANLQAGPVFVTPTLDSYLEYVDNLFRTPDDEKSSGVSILKPRVQAWVENGLNTYSLAYTLIDTRYFDSRDDNYTDNQLNLDIYHEFNAKNAANFYAEYFAGHEERGTGLSEGIPELISEPVEFDRATVGGDYTYGSSSSRGRIKLAAKAKEIEYQNFREETIYRDYDQYGYDTTFFWKVASRTDVLAEVRYQDTEYNKVDPLAVDGDLNSNEYNYFVGVAWDATAKTSGSVKVGGYERQYDSSARDDNSGFSWDVKASYKPRTYSEFTLSSRRFSEETNGQGDAINSNRTELAWDHKWSGRSSTDLSLAYLNSDYAGTEREDDQYEVAAAYNYAMRRWLDLGFGYRYEDRSSSLNFYDYTRNTAFIRATVSL